MHFPSETPEETSAHIQHFLSLSPYAEQLKGILSLSKEKLWDTKAIQTFLEKSDLSADVWDQYLEYRKVQQLLQNTPYFSSLDASEQAIFLQQPYALIAFLHQQGFLEKYLWQTGMFLHYIRSVMIPENLIKRLQFFLDKQILSARMIFFFPIELFVVSDEIIQYLDAMKFFDDTPFFDEEQYIGYEGSIFQQYLLLFCTGQDSSTFWAYETLYPIIDWESPEFSEKLLRLIEVTKKIQPQDWKNFFRIMQHVLDEDNDHFLQLKQRSYSYIQFFVKLINSNVPELQYSPESFLPFILESSDPLEALNALETVYGWSHLPQLVKNFSLFRLLYDDQTLEQGISEQEMVSPYLKTLPAQERIPVIYQDFLTIAINSNEASLKNLITQLVSGLPLLKRFENWFQELKHKKSSSNLPLSFSPEEQNQLFQLFETLEVLPFILHPEIIDHTSFKRKVFSHDQLQAYYRYLLGKLKASEWASLADACDQSFARWGYPQLEGILNSMNEAQKSAMTKNVQQLEKQLTISDWDFLKGVEYSETILQILQTGILSREYIGARGADSDATPFDADFEALTKREKNQSLSDYLKSTYAAAMGSYLFLIKNPNQLFSQDKGYEKIIHNYQGHRGIRTGLPTSEISALIMPEEINSEELEALTYQIAKNGFYLPIYDRNGKLLFTVTEYVILRKTFNFSPRYLAYTLTTDHQIEKQQDPDLQHLVPQQWFMTTSNEAQFLSDITAKKIQTYLKELDIFVSLEEKHSHQEARLLNIGSTGRGTATDLSTQDQDFVLILPPHYADKKEEIAAYLHEKIRTSQKAENEGPRENGAYQLRSKVNQLGKSWSSLPFDLLIMENIYGVQISSAQAMQERLAHILKTQGQSAYDAVLSHIRAAKSLLAQYHIYTRAEGGLGGIGVEHWILQNEWSLEKALKSFEVIAYQGAYHTGKKPLSLQEFQKQYPIYDTGYNRKNGTIDNYVLELTEESYHKLLQICIASPMWSWNTALE